MDTNNMKPAIDVGLPGATFITMLSDATVILQFMVALATVSWLCYRMFRAWRGNRATVCVVCPLNPDRPEQ